MAIIGRLLKEIKENEGLGLVAVGNGISALIGGGMWLLFASFLNTQQYGEVNFKFAVGTIASSLAVVGFNSTVARLLSLGQQSQILTIHWIVIVASVIAGSVTYFIVDDLSVVLLVIFASVFAMSCGEYLGYGLYRQYMVVSVISKIAQVTLSFVLYFQMGPSGILLGYAIPNLLLSLRMLTKIRFKIALNNNIRSALKFSVTGFLVDFSRTITLYFDKILIGSWFGYSPLGQYQFASQFLILLSTIPMSIFYFALSKSDLRTSVKLSHVLLLSAALSGLFIVASPYIIASFFENFIDDVPTSQVISIAIIPMSISAYFSSKDLRENKYFNIIMGSIIYISTTILTIYIFGNVYGAIGFAFAAIIANSIQAVYLSTMARS